MDQTLADAQAQRARLEGLFVSALPDIERVSRFVARRHRLSAAEADDFCSEVNLRIIEDDYGVLALFEGRSSLRTYLTTVIQRVFLDYRRKQWGKWRPSAEAHRRGPLALRLEVLIYRDGLSLDEAFETLRANFGGDTPRDALLALANALPKRALRRPVNDAGEELAAVPADPSQRPDAQFDVEETARRVQAGIDEAMESLSPRDRIILRMRFEDGLSVADVARVLRLDQKRLYRHIESLLETFRKSLENRGLEWSEVLRLIEAGRCHLVLPKVVGETPANDPSEHEVAV